MKSKIDDAMLYRIFWMLFKIFKNSSIRGEYPIFPPEKIEMISRKSLRYEIGAPAGTLREGLRFLGVTLYHLATGKSEFNNESIRLDGYNEKFESQYWPAVEYLLSAQAFSLPQVERMFSRLSQLKNKISRAWIVGRGRIASAFPLLVRSLKFIGRSAKSIGRRLWNFWYRSDILIILVLFLFWSLVFVIVQGPLFGYLRQLGISFLVFAISFITIICVFALVNKINDGHEERNNNFMTIFSLFLLPLIFAAHFYFSFCCARSYDPRVGNYGIKNDAVIIDRQTGELAWRWPQSEDNQLLAYPADQHPTFNPFRYKSVAGLPVSSQLTYANQVIAYKIPDADKYRACFDKFRTKDGLKNAILSSVDGKVADLLKQQNFDQKVKKFNENAPAIKATVTIDSPDYGDAERQELEAATQTAAAKELKKIFDKKMEACRNEAASKAVKEVKDEFSQYLELKVIDNKPAPEQAAS